MVRILFSLRKVTKFVVFFSAALIFIVIMTRSSIRYKPLTFQEAVLKYSDQEKRIFLATVDSSYVEMAFNLYLTSFLPLNISNFLFIGADSKACPMLNDNDPIQCFSYDFKEKEGNISSSYGSAGFRRKTHYKTQVILDALRLGYTVIIVDLDIVFFKNPLKHFPCSHCDIQIQSDVSEGNTGFYMVRPTNASIRLHETALKRGKNHSGISNQKAIDRIMESMIKRKTINQTTLNAGKFPVGYTYFEQKKIMFLGDGTCKDCVLLHNNWIVSQAAKIYRFKENGMWQVDSKGYYSDPTRKYLTYDNPVDFGPNLTLRHETEALKTALDIGHLLNRTLILPAFHCYGCKYGACRNKKKTCALNTFYKIAVFDKYFKDSYREHVFLSHPKVPESVKNRQSPRFFIASKASEDLKIKNPVEGKTLVPKDTGKGATDSELISWFRGGTYGEYSVLRFHSLYGAVLPSGNTEFLTKIEGAFSVTDYRQY